jgi:excisionase family DNA binding protein
MYDYTYGTAALYLGVTERTLRRLKSQGKVGYRKIGRQVRFSRKDLDALLASHTFTAGEQ